MRRMTLALSLVLLGCGESGPGTDVPYNPFDPDLAKPGNSGYGSGSGSSPDGGTTEPKPPMCAETERRCAHAFVWSGTEAIPLGTEASVEVIGDFRPTGWTNGEPLAFSGGKWTAEVPVPWNKPVTYKFHIKLKNGGEKWAEDPANPTTVPDGFGGKNSVLSGQTCTTFTCATPSNPLTCAGGATGGFDWRDAVMYFVFVDRFYDGNPNNNAPNGDSKLKAAVNWQGGDWAGVTKKIESGYFTSLGINTLWLSVPMDSADAIGIGDDGEWYSGYHGYWPRDLSKTERRLGTDQDLKALVDAAHAANIKVLVDYAMNHVHVDSPIYQQHTSDGWFNPLEVNGQKCICGSQVCPWEGAMSKVCWFRDYLPDFNFANAQARAYSVQNAVDWLTSMGFDGFRLDAVKHIELSWLTDLRAKLLAEVEPMLKQHVYLVGETFTGDRDLIKSFINPCTMLDGQFDFPMRVALTQRVLMRQGSLKDHLVPFMDGNVGFYGQSVMSTFVGNHDVPRSIHFAEDAPLWNDPWASGKDRNWTNRPEKVTALSAYERLAVAQGIVWTNRGVPLLYYGDEIGLPGAGDPDNRRFMAWDDYNAGQTLLLERMKKLGAIRAAHPALRRGDRTTLSSTADIWTYLMADGADRVYVAVNRSDSTQSATGLPSGTLKDEMTGEMLSGPSVSLPPRSIRIMPQ